MRLGSPLSDRETAMRLGSPLSDRETAISLGSPINCLYAKDILIASQSTHVTAEGRQNKSREWQNSVIIVTGTNSGRFRHLGCRDQFRQIPSSWLQGPIQTDSSTMVAGTNAILVSGHWSSIRSW